MRNLFALAVGTAALAVVAGGTRAAAAPQAGPTHAVVGTVKTVDSKSGTVVVQAQDGSLHTVKVPPATKTSSISEAAKAVAKDAKAVGQSAGAAGRDSLTVAKEGAHVVVHYSEDAAGKTAHAVKQAADGTAQTVKGVVTKVDKASRTITVKTKDGVEHVFQVATSATITAGRRVSEAGQEIGSAVKEGAETTVHFVNEGGKKIAHAIER
jgi:hypothetical protein